MMFLDYIILTGYFVRHIIETEHMFRQVNYEEDFTMTDNELELLYIIRTSENPEKALKTALDLMIDFLEKHEELRDTSYAHPLESA